MNTNIAILGAGYAGVKAAKTLNKKFKKDDSVNITLIDQNPYHTLLTELHEVAGNRVETDAVKLPLNELFANTKVDIVQETITDIDSEQQVLKSTDSAYDYDYLILGIGSEPTYFGIPGLEEHSFTLWSIEDAEKLNNHIRNMFKLAANESDLKKREEMLTFVIGGGGFTGVETAGEIAEWVDELCTTYDVDREEVNIKLVETKPDILPVLNKGQINKAWDYLTKNLEVEPYTHSAICEVTENSVSIRDQSEDCEDNKVLNTRTLIWTGGVKAKDLTQNLNLDLNRRDRVDVNEYLQTSIDNIYAVGDNAFFETDEGHALPQLVEAAVQGGECAAHNVYAQVKGKEQEEFDPQLHGVMVSLGSNYAVAELKPISGLTIPLAGFIAMMTKHMINLHYLFDISGFKFLWDYIEHQFKDTRGGIGLLVRHFAKKSGTFWLAFLRVFLGVRFLIEGINKFQKGWLLDSKGHLVSGASSVLWTDSTPEWFVQFAKTFIVPNQVLFQKIIVLTEFAIGISFIFGFLTVLGAIAAIGMSANFIMGSLGSQGVWGPIWMLLISITMLSNPGKAFGVDYYLLPWLFNLSEQPAEFDK